jgi:flagellar biosynthesis anti-sigma factor FlgM
VKIISANPINPLPLTERNAAGTTAQRVELQTTEVTSDEDMQAVEVSSVADTDSGSDVDMDRVAQLRQAIGSGTLQISSESIYDGLVSSAREMLGTDVE